MIYVISDLHGYPHGRFLQLLAKAGFGKNDFLYILGDVVDRNGDGGVETLTWLLYQSNVQLILGNHEAMLLACSFVFEELTDENENKITPENVDMLRRYYYDGGSVTLNAMSWLTAETRGDIIDYLRDCPLYECLSAGGRDYLLVHSGFENFDKNKKLSEYEDDELLWARPELEDRYFQTVTTVLGHTPTLAYGDEYKDKIIVTDTWIDIDMGAGFGREPVLLRLDDMKEFRLEESK